MPTSTDEMSAFVSSLTFDDLPKTVVEHAKLDILDTVGCALFGSTLPIAKILQATFRAFGHVGSTPVWGMDWSLDGDTAALVNGTLTHSFELDDLHPRGILHPGGCTLPAILGVANPAETSGSDIIAAHVAGLEIACRVGLACGPELLIRGWHNNGVLGVFGGAGGSASVLGLSESQTKNAIGTAASLASGLIAAQYGSMVKRMHAGQAAQTGARAGLLAKNGFLGIDNVMEVEYGGFFTTYVDAFRPEELSSELGTRWETLNVGFKMYPACGSSHTTISVLEQLLAEGTFVAGDVERVTVHSSTATHKHVGWEYSPLSVTTAQMNLPYAAATTLLRGSVTVNDYTDTAIRDPEVIDLARRVVTVPEREIDDGKMDRRHEVWLQVELKDGRTLTGEARDAPGSPRNPAPKDRVVSKFMQLASTALPRERCESIRDLILNLDMQPDLGVLTSHLKG